MATISYTLHPLLEVRISSDRTRYLNYFDNEYKRIPSVPAVAHAVIIHVTIVRSFPTPQPGDRYRHIRFKKLFQNKFIIRGLESNYVEIFFKDNWMASLYSKIVTLFLQAQVLEPIIYHALLRNNILLMHAAGVSDGRHGFLFPAYGGTGKTTLTLGLMGEGFGVLGDDLLFVEPDRARVRPYLRPLHIFTYNVNTLRGATIPLAIRAKVRAKDILRYALENVTGQDFLISTRVHAEKLYKDFIPATAVPYRKIVFLKNEGADETVQISPENVETLAQTILDSADLNESLYQNILEPEEISSIKTLELGVIKNVLKNASAIDFVNTRLLNFRDLRGFKERLLS